MGAKCKPPNTSGLRPWPKGVSGNPGGRPKKLPITDVLREELEKRGKHNVMVSRSIARKLIDLALAGNIEAMHLIADRAEGKVPQRVEQSGPDGAPIQFDIPETRDALERRIAELLNVPQPKPARSKNR